MNTHTASTPRATFAALIEQENNTLAARFTKADIIDPLALAETIHAGDNPLAACLRGWLSETDRKHLAGAVARHRVGASELAPMVEVLNAALQIDELPAECHEVAARAEERLTEILPNCPPEQVPPICRNRLVIETAFQGLVCPSNWQTEVRLAAAGDAAEPWVAFTKADRVGLALSGGGIRSATFNLGLLQAIAARGLLGRFHYLATVSGGGYVGGFWTRWRRNRRCDTSDAENHRFPHASGPASPDHPDGPREIREPREIRHLREFSRFLIPRSGLNAEFWAAAAAILVGVLPAMLAAIAVVLATMTGWAAVGVLPPSLGIVDTRYSLVVMALLCTLFGLSLRQQESLDAVAAVDGARRSYRRWYGIGVFVSLGMVYVAMRWLPGARLDPESADTAPHFRPSFALLWALVATTALQLLARRIGNESMKGHPNLRRAAWGHLMGQLLAFLAIWTGLALLWLAAGVVKRHSDRLGLGDLSIGTAATTLLFYFARDWLRQPKTETRAGGLLSSLAPRLGATAQLKSVGASLLANAVVVLLLLLGAITLRLTWDEGPVPALVAYGSTSLLVLLLVLLVCDPSALGLHEFYRSRIARCFLGAGRIDPPPSPDQPPPADDRSVVERDDDDMPLHTDSGLPIHLVCCAANQTTAEDQLATLHRGARSTVLSRFGIAWGDHWTRDRSLRLSSALTASAAAFNPLMGERTMVLSRAVPFMLTALNLRLGLWVRNPAYTGTGFWDDRLPGLQFLRELFGHARCCADSSADPLIHLSDGGHFENLALYELVRRHCRYIVVADAGQDGQFTFDDFGRAVRRVREDFGVEIEIDLAPLKPDTEGRAQQHLAVGVIHYDGVVGTDKGTIVYFKPTLTGEEPPDVLQYARNHTAFPHESTGDQFFDEAQFESYRRLGEHTVNSGFRPLERQTLIAEHMPDETIFWRLRQCWHQVPWMKGDDGIRLWENALKLDEELGGADGENWAPDYLGLAGPAGAVSAKSCQEALRAIRVCKFLEEAWVICELDRYWSHPRASSWMSCLHRWAALPKVRDWWPLLRPLFGTDFQVFAEHQLHLPKLPRPQAPAAAGASPEEYEPVELAARRMREVLPHTKYAEGTVCHELVLVLPAHAGARPVGIQVGLAFVRENRESGCARWALEDLFIVPEMSFGSYRSRLLDSLVEHYRHDTTFERLEIDLYECEGHEVLVRRRMRRNQASRRAHSDLIDFYRSRGFVYDDTRWEHGRCVGMVLPLEPRWMKDLMTRQAGADPAAAQLRLRKRSIGDVAAPRREPNPASPAAELGAGMETPGHPVPRTKAP